MFGLLRKKFNDLSEKIFGKSKEKISSESEDEVSLNESDASLSSSLVEEDVVKPSLVEDPFLEKETVSLEDEKVAFNLGQVSSKEASPLEKSSSIPSQLSSPEKTSSNLGHVSSKDPSPLEKSSSIPSSPSFQNKEKQTPPPSKAYQELEGKKVEEVKRSTLTKLKGLFVSKIKLSEKEISSFLDDFEISLLEADVSITSSQAIIDDLKERLLSFSFSKSDLLFDIKEKIKDTLKTQLNIDCDIDHYISKEKDNPLIILIIGPNGAGKTTTISKFAHLYKQKGKSVVLASSDTFRAGSIDQLEIHAKRLGVRVIKQNYGSDPAAVAFDAVSSAKANKNDVVLIDTAGRQDTNINLMQELSKIKRVVKPHLTIYIGESQAGQAIVEQIEKFDKEIGITGVILTKIDTDPKGGVAISILNELKKPIFYIGTGQEYNDIEKFSPDYIIERII